MFSLSSQRSRGKEDDNHYPKNRMTDNISLVDNWNKLASDQAGPRDRQTPTTVALRVSEQVPSCFPQSLTSQSPLLESSDAWKARSSSNRLVVRTFSVTIAHCSKAFEAVVVIKQQAALQARGSRGGGGARRCTRHQRELVILGSANVSRINESLTQRDRV